MCVAFSPRPSPSLSLIMRDRLRSLAFLVSLSLSLSLSLSEEAEEQSHQKLIGFGEKDVGGGRANAEMNAWCTLQNEQELGVVRKRERQKRCC